ncbi:MAG: sirohydrochlorin chelatase [Pseudanabaena sp. RU_4_16]|nr:sirohydrochlorin chelatase [Pseudanabaena sp. RU_4_16]
MSSVLSQDTRSNIYDAYFLVTHGSKSPLSWAALQTLITSTNTLTEIFVGGGCLEGQPITLAQQLQQFCENLSKQSDLEHINVAVIPLFLLPGVHVKEDIPTEIAIAQQKMIDSIEQSIALELTPHLGTHPQIPTLLQSQLEAQIALIQHRNHKSNQNIGPILLSHGSRLTEAFQTIETLADRLGAIAAYWSVPPDLDTQIEKLIAQGKEHIIVMPYFLSSGGIMEAISQQISLYGDSLTDASRRVQIDIAPVPFSPEQIALFILDLPGLNRSLKEYWQLD